MVAADAETKANHPFKFRAIGAVTAQLHGSFVASTIPAAADVKLTGLSFTDLFLEKKFNKGILFASFYSKSTIPSCSAGSKTCGARSKLVGMPPPPPINLLFNYFLTSPFRRFLGRVDVLNHFEPALSVCCPLWAYLVLFHEYGVKVIVAKIIII